MSRNLIISKISDDIVADEKGRFQLHLPTNSLVTLSTISTAAKGSFSPPPPSSSFPLPYKESFSYNGFSEAKNFADQAGAFEIFQNKSSDDGHEWTLRQVSHLC